ncbi:MAG: amidohydrolase, partial [Sphingobacteriales bacterium]
MTIIDSHVHFWKYNAMRDAWMNPMPVLKKDYLPYELQDIITKGGCVAIQADQSEEETIFLLQLAGTFSFIKGIVGWVDLRADNIEERLAYYSGQKIIKGWRHIV